MDVCDDNYEEIWQKKPQFFSAFDKYEFTVCKIACTVCVQRVQHVTALKGFIISIFSTWEMSLAAKIPTLDDSQQALGPRNRKSIQSNRCRYFRGRPRVLCCQLLAAECVHTMKSQTSGL